MSFTKTVSSGAVAAGITIFLGLGLHGAQAQGKDPFGNKFDHYQCYQIVDGGSGFQGGVKLSDQFGGYAAGVVKAVMLCNPVDKNGEGIPNKDVHLICYSIKVDGPNNKVYGVAIQNQFETTKYYVRGAQLLCVPSTKKLL